MSSAQMAEVSETGITLKELETELKARGVGKLSYTALSDFINQGDIAEQLGLNRGRGRKTFPPPVVDILAQFLPRFQEAGGKLPQAPNMLRAFVSSLKLPHSLAEGSESLSLVLSSPQSPAPRVEVDPLELAALQGRAAGLASQDRPLTAQEAADLLHISVPMLRRSIKPYRRFGKSSRGDRWRFSDLLASE